MLEEIINRFVISDVSLCRSSAERQKGWMVGIDNDRDLIYRIGRGEDNPVNVYVAESKKSATLVIYRFTITLACRVFKRSVFEAAAEGTNPEDIEAVCQVLAIYDADYVAEGGTGEEDEFDPDALESFAQHNVAYHVWPFFREHLHSALSKMQVQPITLQMLQVPKSHRKADKKPARKIKERGK